MGQGLIVCSLVELVTRHNRRRWSDGGEEAMPYMIEREVFATSGYGVGQKDFKCMICLYLPLKKACLGLKHLASLNKFTT